jgi:hypothetical protein
MNWLKELFFYQNTFLCIGLFTFIIMQSRYEREFGFSPTIVELVVDRS